MEQKVITEEQRNKERELDKMVTMVANEWAPDKRCEDLKAFIMGLLDLYEKRLHMDKLTIFMALEAKRDYSAMNYYQESRFGYLKEVETLEKEKSDIYARLKKEEEAHKEKLVEIAKAQAEALQVRTEGVSKATAQWDVSLTVTCPYCHDPQDAFTEWQAGEKWDEVAVCQSAEFKDFEMECGRCGRHFEVKDAQY